MTRSCHVQNVQDERISPSQGIPVVSDNTLGNLEIEIPRSNDAQPEGEARPAGPACTLY